MQQQIGFCTTADGARIAYATVGAGPALVVVPFAPCHFGLEWEEPRVRDFWETVGRHHLVVRYDKHGCGLSDRNRSDFSFDAEVRTIEAIVTNLELKSFVLWGEGGQGAAAAIAYTTNFPDRVSRLIFCNAQARWHRPGAAWLGASQQIWRALARSNPRMSLLSVAEGMLGSAFDTAALQRYLDIREEGVTGEVMSQLVDAQVFKMDVRDLLPRIRVPALVVHYQNDRMIPFEAGRELAAEIPGAKFALLEGDAHVFCFNDTRPLLHAIAEFLGDPIEDAVPTHADYPKVPSAAEAPRGIFRREGEFWTIASSGKVFRLKDIRGLACIAYLLGHAREEVHALTLASKTDREHGEAEELVESATEGEAAAQSGLIVGRMGDAGAMLDAHAKAAYKRRVTELGEQLEEARARNQSEVVDRLKEESETLRRELSRAVGLGGRDRRAASASERARINVTRAIKVALERIAEHDPALAALLAKSLRTGTFCSYTPDSRLPSSWQL
jgi:pimeloyl-ACP methyl ester carboxylesterase